MITDTEPMTDSRAFLKLLHSPALFGEDMEQPQVRTRGKTVLRIAKTASQFNRMPCRKPRRGDLRVYAG